MNDIWGAEKLKGGPSEWNTPIWKHDLDKGRCILQLDGAASRHGAEYFVVCGAARLRNPRRLAPFCTQPGPGSSDIGHSEAQRMGNSKIRRASSGLGAVGLMLVVACSSGGGGAAAGGALGENGEPPPAWASEIGRTDTCTQTSCEASYDACEQRQNECWSTCATMLDVAYDCASVCMGMDCTPCTSSDSDSCAEYDYSFELKKPADPQLLAACKAAVSRDVGCGEATILSDCEHYSRVEDPMNVSAYTCLSKLGCGEDATACFASIQPSPAADEYVKSFNQTCAGQYQFDPANVDAFAEQLGWLKEPIVDALVDCTHESCINANTCVEAWFATVYPGA